MNASQSIYFIGCGVLAPDIDHITQTQDLKLKRKYLPGGLHEDPQELRRRLQAAIDTAARDETCRRIIIGYGLCGKGSVGIKAPDTIPLVFPRVHDCIALFLGSDQAYKKEFERCPGTYYISAGWHREKSSRPKDGADQVWIGSQAMGSKEIKERFGDKGGGDIIRFFSSWQKNYQRAAFIDTGIGNTGRSSSHARDMAKKYDWAYEKIEGNLSLMMRLVTAEVSDDQILVVPPGYVTTYSAVDSGLAAAPEAGAGTDGTGGPRTLVFGDGENKTYENNACVITRGLGIDAGGTYTDAAVYDFTEKKLKAKSKALTTKWDFSIGIDEALSRIAPDLLAGIELVSVSTTLATNAIVENDGQKAGLILMCDQGGRPDQLIPHTPKAFVKGKLNISGNELAPIDPDEIRRTARQMVDRDQVSAFAVSGYGGAANPAHELAAKQIIQEETGMIVTCGHELSSMLNFVVRAQTAVLNARIIQRMVKFFKELDTVLKRRGIKAPVMVVKGDGTLMSSAMAIERPVETILSGPAASVAGAKLMTGLDDAMVVDIGGTTTDTAELSGGLVAVCDSGARVGGITTHVKALDMRTVGLGGDSHIRWEKEQLKIGPRRVAPVVWADARFPGGVEEAVAYLVQRISQSPLLHTDQTIITAMEGEFPFEPTAEETRIYATLQTRPYALDELAGKLKLLSARSLRTERLEGWGLVQRCGLTPTDLLHVTGQFEKWPTSAAERMVAILAGLSGMTPEAFIRHMIRVFEKELARELLKKQLAKDVRVNDSTETELSQHLIDCILSGKQNGYGISATLEHPVIGIGAPAHFFLPQAGKRLNGNVIIPKDADVANALGAVSSHVMIKQEVTIQPGDTGGFRVEGMEGSQRFNTIDAAENWAVDALKDRVRAMGRFAGTSRRTVEMEISDRVVTLGNQSTLFLGRTIRATLSGSPDLVLETARSA